MFSSAVPETDTLPDDPRRVLTFSLAGADYALDLRWVREIRTPETPTPLPGQPPAVLGVTNLRGDMVPLLCLRTQLQQAAPTQGSGAVVVVQLPRGLLGLLVDAVQDVRELDAGDLRPPPFPQGRAAHLLGLYQTGRQPLQLLDPMALASDAALH
ncbi:chemotaxis protein CheW [Inhella proteolytica]|uniref:Purine-binding chemotaxis protein CheW n=1 Tax=Inhella proteolytica TaxID=2795029 RepID=A0A931IYN3_9BURK|nr:chemotaxis protein CheW [Inhella proteolytica]MBH9575468.1 purine-binding chemotaxis protein CheW [Inhella proteolytica]